jgi:hypothetical protein
MKEAECVMGKLPTLVHALAVGIAFNFGVDTDAIASAVISGVGKNATLSQHSILLAVDRRQYDDGDEVYNPAPYGFAPAPRAYGYAQPPARYVDAPDYELLPPPPPANCGEYHCWNGEYCADARYNPPYVSPRW